MGPTLIERGMIPYGRQTLSPIDDDLVLQALHSERITQGPMVDRFESALADYVGAKYGVAFSSGTAALHAAYFVAGVGPTRGIVTSAITFVATANAAHALGAPVRLIDRDQYFSVKGDSEAVVPVHYAGHYDTSWLRASGDLIIEDAAHALGATYNEHRVGKAQWSDLCCFSFHPVKAITTGEGGMVTTNDWDLAQALRRFRDHGRRKDPLVDPWRPAWQVEMGLNYRMTELQAALGLAQLQRLDFFLARRREIAAWYDAQWLPDEPVEPLRPPPGCESAYHLYVVRVPGRLRDAVCRACYADGIAVQVHYPPVYHHPYQRARCPEQRVCPEAERFYAEAVSLPIYPLLTEADQRRVAAAVRRGLSA